jgi:stage IV sporulation protein B
MFFKKLKTISVTFLLTFLIFPLNLLAYSSSIYVGGENIGINLKMDGVLIIGTYEINGIDKAKKAGIKKGDIIIKIDNTPITKIDDMIAAVEKKETVTVVLKRNNKQITVSLPIEKENNIYKTGLYVKDSITGIGTLTFIDPETSSFGALGHEIVETETGVMLEIKDGSIFSSTVTSIDRSLDGTPGSKNASLDTTDILGEIKENSTSGIFGTYTKDLTDKTLYKVASIDDINLGKATIKTVTDGSEVEEYEIEIIKIDKDSKTSKNILFEVTDKTLLEKSGGIVQGMRGSPIIQGEYIIGAVTHVVVNHPEKGYGIFIGNMLEEMERDN